MRTRSATRIAPANGTNGHGNNNDSVTNGTSHAHPPSTSRPPRRIAVVGSGIAGLSAAWLLSGAGKGSVDEVVLYEKAAGLGMDAHTVSVDLTLDRNQSDDSSCQQRNGHSIPRVTVTPAAGPPPSPQSAATTRVRLDMPLRVFTETYYTNLTALYKSVGVEFEANNYSGSFVSRSHAASPTSTLNPTNTGSSHTHTNDESFHFGYRNLLLGRYSLPLSFLPFWECFWRGESWQFVLWWIRFLWGAKRDAKQGGMLRPGKAKRGSVTSKEAEATDDDHDDIDDEYGISLMDFGSYLTHHNYSPRFLDKMLLPTLCAILTCSRSAVLAYPAVIIVDYLLRRNLHGVRHVTKGTEDVVQRLVKDVEVRLATGVKKIHVHESDGTHRQPNGTRSNGHSDSPPGIRRVRIEDEHGGIDYFDEVILASQANQASQMLVDCPSLKSRADALAQVPYERSTLVLHRDPKLMPRDRATWNAVNFLLPDDKQLCPYSRMPTTTNSPPSSPACSNGVSHDPHSPSPPSTPTSPPSSISHCFDNEGMATIYLNRTQACLYAIDRFHKAPPTSTTPSDGSPPTSSAPSSPLASSLPDFFQSWNPPPHLSPDPALTLYSARFDRPIVTASSLRAIRSLEHMQGAHGIWICGSYFNRCAMPLLESAVTSAVRVAKQLGADVPWRTDDEIHRHGMNGRHQYSVMSSLTFTLLTVAAVLLTIWWWPCQPSHKRRWHDA